MSTQPAFGPKVFISYTHDTPQHRERVLELSRRLAQDWVECTTDHDQDPEEGRPRWMVRQIERSDYVLLICTEAYLRRFLGEEAPGQGLGATWEGHVITQSLYEAQAKNAKFLPVIFSQEDAVHIPIILRGFNYYNLSLDGRYGDLLRRISRLPHGDVKPERPSDVSPSSSQPRVWDVPHARNRLFSGRPELMAQLERALTDPGGPVALFGLGGIGKTLVAVEFAYRHRQKYGHIFWVAADSAESIKSGFVRVASLLGLQDADITHSIDAVRKWLENHRDWLMVLDNLEDSNDLAAYASSFDLGHVLITTRNPATGSLALGIEVFKLDPAEAALFLLRRAKILRPDQPLESATPANLKATEAIVEEMDGLPLALEQAGAYIEETPSNPGEYLSLYRAHGQELRARSGQLHSYEHSVSTTWLISFEQVTRLNPTAGGLLRICSFMAPDDIPEELFGRDLPLEGPRGREFAAHHMVLNKAIADAGRFSLLKRNASTKALFVHRLVQAAVVDSLPLESRAQHAKTAVVLLYDCLPKHPHNPGNWALFDRLLPHCWKANEVMKAYGLGSSALECNFLLLMGSYLEERGQYDLAELLLGKACLLGEYTYGRSSPNYGASLNNLGTHYYRKGDLRKASELWQAALSVFEKAYGRSHPEAAGVMMNLAGVLEAQEKFSEAEALNRRALRIMRRRLGPQHQSVALILQNLGSVFLHQGKLTEADALYEQSESVYRSLLGTEHLLDLALLLSNQGALRRKQERFREGLQLHQDALNLRQTSLGCSHPSLIQDLLGMAGIYQDMSRFDVADALCQRALAIGSATLSTDHREMQAIRTRIEALRFAEIAATRTLDS